MAAASCSGFRLYYAGSGVGRWVSAPLAACLLALAAAGCTGRAVSAGTTTPARSPRVSQSATSASPRPVPVGRPRGGRVRGIGPAAAGRHGSQLPAGAYYLLAGRSLSSLNVWEVGPGGALTQLTHNPPGHGVDALAASSAGIVVGDAADGTDRLARWTRHGPSWLRHSYRWAPRRRQLARYQRSRHHRLRHPAHRVRRAPGRELCHLDPALLHQPGHGRLPPAPPAGRPGVRAARADRHRRLDRAAGQPPAGRADLPPRRRHDAHYRGVRDTFPAGLGPSRARAGRRVPGEPGRAALPRTAGASRCRPAGSRWPGTRRAPSSSCSPPRAWASGRPLPPRGCARSASSHPRCRSSRRSGWPGRRRCDRWPGPGLDNQPRY